MIIIIYGTYFEIKLYNNLHKMVGWFTESKNRQKCFINKSIYLIEDRRID